MLDVYEVDVRSLDEYPLSDRNGSYGGTNLKSLMTLGALYVDIQEAFQKLIDIITVDSLLVLPMAIFIKETSADVYFFRKKRII